MATKKKVKILKVSLTVVIIVILAIFIWKLAPFILDLSTKEGQVAFKDKISDMGFIRVVTIIWFTNITNIISSIARGAF